MSDSIETTFNSDFNAIIRTVTAKITVADVKNVFDDSLHHAEFKKDMHVIWDIGKTDISTIEAHELIEIVNHIQSRADMRGSEYKIAIVAPTRLSYGISRMFEGYGYVLPQTIGILKNMDDAYHWISSSQVIELNQAGSS